MPHLVVVIAGFLLCTTIIVLAGSKLSYYGDRIATLTGMGKAWLGLVMMASITSLPELITGVSAIMVVNAPDIAAGDVMGSCVFNLLILAVLDALTPGQPVYNRAGQRHVPAILLNVLLLASAATVLAFPSLFPALGWISTGSVLLLALYFFAVRLLYNIEQKATANDLLPLPEPLPTGGVTLPQALLRYLFFALLVVAGALGLPYFAEQLALTFGLQQSIVGTLMVATTTSLPELTVSIAALRIGSADMAIGNLLGSNLFNMLILVTDDVLYTAAPLYDRVDPVHMLSVLAALVMTSIAGLAMLAGGSRKTGRFAGASVMLIGVYLALVVSLWRRQ